MADIARGLAALEVLERRYDGPIPEPLRQEAWFGSAGRRLLVEAEGQARFFTALVADQIEAIRRARQTGTVPPRLFADLKLYRRRELWWRREAWRLAAVTPSAGDAP
jgi:hypothetical protein